MNIFIPIFLFFLSGKIGIITEEQNEELLTPVVNKLVWYFENDWQTDIYYQDLNQNLFDFGEAESLDFVISLSFEGIDTVDAEVHLPFRVDIFDIGSRRVDTYSKEIVLEMEGENLDNVFLYQFSTFLNSSIPKVMKVSKIESDKVYLQDPYFAFLSPGQWIKIYTHREFSAFAQIKEIIFDTASAKLVWTKRKFSPGDLAIVSYPPSGFLSISLLPIGTLIEADTGGNIPVSRYSPGFGMKTNYYGFSKWGASAEISFFPDFSLWNLMLSVSRAFLLEPVSIVIYGGFGSMFSFQKTKDGKHAVGSSFFISPGLSLGFSPFHPFVLSLNVDYPIGGRIFNFTQTVPGGEQVVPDSLLINREISVKGPVIKLGIGAYLKHPLF